MSHGVTMRVAIITESFPPDVNGVAHCVLRVAELLASHGHHPLVIAPQPPRARRDGKASYPFPVVRVPAVPLPGYPGFRLGLPGRRVRSALIRHQADVFLQTDNKTAALITRLLGASGPRLAERGVAQMEMFFSALVWYLDHHPERAEALQLGEVFPEPRREDKVTR